MKLFDIAELYRRSPNPAKPFSYFFNSRGYKTAHAHLRQQGLPENQILIREMPSRTNPSVAKVHPLILVEFLRWYSYEHFARIVNERLSDAGD
jgi:hypothetical protein